MSEPRHIPDHTYFTPDPDALREAAEAALTDFIYANGSDFDAAEWPGMAALRAALAAPAAPPPDAANFDAAVQRAFEGTIHDVRVRLRSDIVRATELLDELNNEGAS